MNQEKYIGMDVHDATISMRASEEALRSKHLQLSWDLHSQTNYLILSALNFCSVLNLSSSGGRCDEGRL